MKRCIAELLLTAVTVLAALGCTRETTRTLPTAVWGDVRVYQGQEERRVRVPHIEEPELSTSTGRISVADLESEPPGLGSVIAEELRTALEEDADDLAREMGPRCGARQPCFAVVDTDAELVFSGRVHQFDVDGIDAELVARNPRTNETVWAIREVFPDADELVIRVLDALVPRSTPGASVVVNSEPAYRVERRMLGFEDREVVVQEFAGRFAMVADGLFRLVPDHVAITSAAYVGVAFPDPPFTHLALFGGGITWPQPTNCLFDPDFGGGARAAYELRYDPLPWLYVGGQVGVGGFFTEARECSTDGTVVRRREATDFVSLGARAGLRFGVFRVGIALQAAVGGVREEGGEGTDLVLDLGPQASLTL